MGYVFFERIDMNMFNEESENHITAATEEFNNFDRAARALRDAGDDASALEVMRIYWGLRAFRRDRLRLIKRGQDLMARHARLVQEVEIAEFKMELDREL